MQTQRGLVGVGVLIAMIITPLQALGTTIAICVPYMFTEQYSINVETLPAKVEVRTYKGAYNDEYQYLLNTGPKALTFQDTVNVYGLGETLLLFNETAVVTYRGGDAKTYAGSAATGAAMLSKLIHFSASRKNYDSQTRPPQPPPEPFTIAAIYDGKPITITGIITYELHENNCAGQSPTMQNNNTIAEKINSLLAQIKKLQDLIGTLRGHTTQIVPQNSQPSSLTGTQSCSTFVDITYGMFDTDTSGRVSQLQTWLGIPSNTFGFGTYGPRTRALWNSKCGGAQTAPSTTVTSYTSASFEATPMNGSAPLTVNFKGQINVPNNQSGSAVIFFGDGVSDVMFRSGPTLFNESWTHAYSQSGEYDAYLVLSSVSNVDSDIEVMRNPTYYKNTTVRKIHISVGEQSAVPSIVVKSVSGNNLHIQFTNMPEFLFDIVANGTNAIVASNLGPSVNAGSGEALVPIPSTMPSGNYFLRVRATSNGTVLANSASFYITGTWTTYTNNTYNYIIQYPASEGWVYAENGVGVGFGTPASGPGGYIYGVAAYEKNVVSLSTLIARMGDQFSDRQESRQNITINGVPAILVTVTTNQVSGWVAKAVYVEYGNRIYAITNGATDRTDFETFYQSFRIKA